MLRFCLWVTFISHSFFNSLARSRYLSFFSLSFNFTLWSAGTWKSIILQVLVCFFVFCWLLWVLVVWPRLDDPFVYQKSLCQKSLCVSFSRTAVGLRLYHLFVWSNFNFLHNSQLITLPTQSCLVLNSFWINLLHLLIMGLMVSFLSPHNIHLLFCWGLSILALIWLVLLALFCAAIRRDSVSLLRFPFLSHIHIFPCQMLIISRLKRP